MDEIEPSKKIRLGDRDFRLKKTRRAAYLLDSRESEFLKAGDFSRVVLIIWCLIEGKLRPDPEDIAEMLPEDEDELKPIIETVMEVFRPKGEESVEKKSETGPDSESS